MSEHLKYHMFVKQWMKNINRRPSWLCTKLKQMRGESLKKYTSLLEFLERVWIPPKTVFFFSDFGFANAQRNWNSVKILPVKWLAVVWQGSLTWCIFGYWKLTSFLNFKSQNLCSKIQANMFVTLNGNLHPTLLLFKVKTIYQNNIILLQK